MRHKVALLALVVASGSVSGAWAEDGPIRSFWNSVFRDWQRNAAWPDPFVAGDRAAVHGAFEVNVAAGWRLQNTVSDFHFDEQGKLNEAGQLKIKAIMQEHPPERRMVLIVAADEPEMTTARLASAQEAVARYAIEGTVSQVTATYKRPGGWPASHVVQVDRGYFESMQPPVLPPRQTQGSGSGM